MSAATRSFSAETASVPAARRFVRATLQDLELLSAWDAAEMLVSELVTNAVLHARTSFTVSVERHDQAVRVSVTDLSSATPRQRSYGNDSTTGRGLRLVATIALSWGVDRTVAGKTVWFEVRAAGDAGVETAPWDEAIDVDALLVAFDDTGGDGGDGGLTPTSGAWSDQTALGARCPAAA